MSENWSDPPSKIEYHETIKKLGLVRRELIILRRTIKRKDDELKEQYPRKPDLRNKVLCEYLDKEAELETDESDLTLAMTALNYHQSMFEIYHRKVMRS